MEKTKKNKTLSRFDLIARYREELRTPLVVYVDAEFPDIIVLSCPLADERDWVKAAGAALHGVRLTHDAIRLTGKAARDKIKERIRDLRVKASYPGRSLRRS